MRLLVVMTGRDCTDLARRAIESVKMQRRQPDAVWIVDDASEDTSMIRSLVMALPSHSWVAARMEKRQHVLSSQIYAWNALEPADDDVIVFVDLDDQLADENALGIVEDYYEQGAWLTYGSYVPEPSAHPHAAWCRPAIPYPDHAVRGNLFRSMVPHFNHLRTISWRVLKHLAEEDLCDDQGQRWQANADASVMIPCLELAGSRAVFVPDVLYKYTCNNPAAVWRTQRDRLNDEWRQLRARTPKRPLEAVSGR